MVSCIIPVYNEATVIKKTLDYLTCFDNLEIIIVDGGSSDYTLDIAKKYPVNFLGSPKGRAKQMNRGAAVACGSILLFLHADCVFEEGAPEAIKAAINCGAVGGCLTQKIEGKNIFYRMIEFSGNIRAKISKIFYGDQAIFVSKKIFHKLGGFDQVALFEDVLFSRKLRKQGRTKVLANKVYTVPRRWKKQGIAKTTLINWIISLGFMLGISPDSLKELYRDIR